MLTRRPRDESILAGSAGFRHARTWLRETLKNGVS
jgi:hypothetical protein